MIFHSIRTNAFHLLPGYDILIGIQKPIIKADIVIAEAELARFLKST